MCDFNSVLTAWSSLEQGRTDSFNAKSKGEFEAVQMRAQGVIAAANMRADATQVRRQFNEMYSSNIASAAISGLSPESFKSINKANKSRQKESEAALDREAGGAMADANANADLAKIGARIEAKLALKNGKIKALNTASEALQGYKENRLGGDGDSGPEGMGNYFVRSIGFTEDEMAEIGEGLKDIRASFFKKRT